MFTIDKINFAKLKPFDGKTTKCFEQLCYQLAQKEFGHLGTFTPIDGSGGDGGVEFYLTHHNGEKWGWQCKFYEDTGRLNVSSRASEIEKSFEAAIRNHSDLTKWILCLKTDLTTDSLSKKGKFSEGERNWFENKLPQKNTTGRKIKLEDWGETRLVSFLSDKKHIGIGNFFFGELEFSEDWFKDKFSCNSGKVNDKYDCDLHTIDKYTQARIDFFLFDHNYTKLTGELKKELLEKSIEIDRELHDLRDKKMANAEEQSQREKYLLACQDVKKHIAFVFEKIDFVELCFKSNDQKLLTDFKIEELINNFSVHFDKIDCNVFDVKTEAFRDASYISRLMLEFSEIYYQFFIDYFYDEQRELHLIAEPAKGKTHAAYDIAFNRIRNANPAIFITGDKFTNEVNIEDALRKNLGIPQEFNIDDFLKALDVYGSILNIRIPIIIDGLNETTHNRVFSPIWKDHLSWFVAKVLQTKNIVIITTCRASYTERIWANIESSKFCHLYGFGDNETIREAVNKYFTKYKLKADLLFSSLEKFGDPIFLKIFCEIKNPNWKSSPNEVLVNIEEESTYDVFKEYLNQVNKRVVVDNHILESGKEFISKSLNKVSLYLWENNAREMPIGVFYELIDSNSNYEKDRSKADILINEGLVINRDIRDDEEYVGFTYDILAGFMIAESLINKNSSVSYFVSNEFIHKIDFADDNTYEQHPLFEDIISALCLLLPLLKRTSFHELLSGDCFSERTVLEDYIFDKSIKSLFALPAKAIKDDDIELVAKLFLDTSNNREALFDLSFKTFSDVKHPLNAIFFSKLLASLEMNERDITWTEYIRKESDKIEELVAEYEIQCRSSATESKIISQRLHTVSRLIIWFLTSTNRTLRDKTTKTLYFYGRKFPEEFMSLVCDSLKFNDSYVWERTLASLYGVVMAEHNAIQSDNFRKNILPDIAKKIYGLIFKENAPHSTTHIMARDYARGVIEISLIHHPKLFSGQEIKNARPPYLFGGIRNVGEYDYGDNNYMEPINMDFSNYKIGCLVKGGGAYSNPPEKIKVRRQIYWRIYNLGWNAEFFKDAETARSNDSYYSGRGRPNIERYGKKYSWIAFYENAGLRYDLGLLNKDWCTFVDIDPSFPEKPKNEAFLKHDLLGDRTTTLIDWYENGTIPHLKEYLYVKDLNGNSGDWICLDSLITQEDMSIERGIWARILGLIIQKEDRAEVIDLLTKQDINDRLFQKPEHHNTFAGELYYSQKGTYDDQNVLELEVEKKIIKKGEPGYCTPVPIHIYGNVLTIRTDLQELEALDQEISVTKKLQVIFPAMEYSWSSEDSTVNDAGYATVVGKEIVNQLGLLNQPQTFDLLDSTGKLAAVSFKYHKDYSNEHNFVYIRKDLFDKYLSETNSTLIWIIQGEREVRLKTQGMQYDFSDAYPFKERKTFQKIVEY